MSGGWRPGGLEPIDEGFPKFAGFADVQMPLAFQFEVLLGLAGCIVQLASLPHRHEFIVGTVNDQQRAADFADVSQRIESVADHQSVQRNHRIG